MKRSNKIIITAHCILNQNSVIKGWARASGGFPAVINLLLNSGIGIIQLPCPEQRFLGLERPPMTVEEYDTPEYQEHCHQLLEGLVDEILDYHKHGVEVIGLLSIEESPSCCVKKGVFFRELQGQLTKKGINLPTIQLPTTHQEDDLDEEYLEKIKKILDN